MSGASGSTEKRPDRDILGTRNTCVEMPMQRRQPNEDVVHDTVILTALHIARGRVYNELSRAYRDENFNMLVYKVDSDANTAGPGVIDLLLQRQQHLAHTRSAHSHTGTWRC